MNQKSHALEAQRLLQGQRVKQEDLDLNERMKLREIKLRELELQETAKRNAIENKKLSLIKNKNN